MSPGATSIERRPDGSYRLVSVLEVGAAIDDAFRFLGDAANLEAAMPGFLGLDVLTPLPVEMGVGTEIEYRLRLHRIPVRWRSEFVAWEPPQHFAYEQRRGPFRAWRHDHTFERVPGGGTRVRDECVYRVPTGRLAHGLLVRRDLERLFAERAEHLTRMLR